MCIARVAEHVCAETGGAAQASRNGEDPVVRFEGRPFGPGHGTFKKGPPLGALLAPVVDKGACAFRPLTAKGVRQTPIEHHAFVVVVKDGGRVGHLPVAKVDRAAEPGRVIVVLEIDGDGPLLGKASRRVCGQ